MPAQSRRLSATGIEILRGLVKRNDWKQAELAKALDVSRSTLNVEVHGVRAGKGW
jgi:transcriptional regulator with XRE-family HTH domain